MSQAHPLTAWLSLTLFSIRVLHKLLQPQEFKLPQIHLLVPTWALQRPGPGENTWEGKDVHLLPVHGPGPGSPAFQPMGLPPTVFPAYLLLPNFSSSLPSFLAITWVEEGSLFLFQFFTTTSWGVVG